ncbi:MAG TPA: glycosyltransferase [Acidobacteriaceae bacterium]|jgi:glycosyltransferase involved in cell wall biosynthesis|nr:glycosyltransferase [Acidobacteriaceae bacterium]
MNPIALIFRTGLLPPSETFIATQAHALRRYAPVFAGLRRIPAGFDLDPCETVLLTRTSTPADKLRRRLFLHTGIAPQFQRALRVRHPALLHAHFGVDAAIALPLEKHLRVPLLVTLHGYDATTSDASLRRTLPGRLFLRRRTELRTRARLFICVSEHIRQQALARGVPADKLRVLPIGVDLSLFAPDPCYSRSLDPIVLFIGRLVEKKGCEHLLRAMALVEKRHPTAKLLIVGDGPLLDPLRAQARATVQHCTFLGAQPPCVVRDLMHRASVLAATSVVAANGDTEGLPIVLCEAQAIGLPIAAFHGPGVDEAVVDQETALLSPSGDHAALADCIDALLNDPALAASLAAAGRRRAETHFSLSTQTALLEDIYDELLR